MNARQRRKQARRLYILKDGRCFRHPDKPVTWEYPRDGRWRAKRAAEHKADALVYARAGRRRDECLMLWAALHRRAALMLQEPTPRPWWYGPSDRKRGRYG